MTTPEKRYGRYKGPNGPEGPMRCWGPDGSLLCDVIVVEWVPGKWWVVESRPGRGYTPLHGPFTGPEAAERASAVLEALNMEK